MNKGERQEGDGQAEESRRDTDSTREDEGGGVMGTEQTEETRRDMKSARGEEKFHHRTHTPNL